MLATQRSIGLRRRARGAAMGLCLALAACGRSPAAKLDQALQTATSWAATAAWIGETWARGAVPAHFAERALARAGETLADQEEQLAELPPAARAALGAHLRSLGAAVGAARQAVSRGDSQAIAQPLARIAGEERALRAMSGEDAGEARPAP
jgi:hypothetical protein